MENVSIIIPAYNEEKTIGQVIDLIKQNNKDCEIIVVDNCCTDNTDKVAKQKEVKLVYADKKGKGYAMEEGLKHASNEIVVFLDADILDYNQNLIQMLVEPIQTKNVDFVKSSFERTKGGMVTEIATKPLLEIVFPEVYSFQEPLSGMIAAKKEWLEKIVFEKDYGVDIGIVIDMTKLGAKIVEVNIGKIENMSHLIKTTESMRKMSTEIIQAIVKKARQYHKF